MRFVVDEMPNAPWLCLFSKMGDLDWNNNREYICPFDETFCTQEKCESHQCQYLVTFKDMFEDKISNYDCQEFDPYRYG